MPSINNNVPSDIAVIQLDSDITATSSPISLGYFVDPNDLSAIDFSIAGYSSTYGNELLQMIENNQSAGSLNSLQSGALLGFSELDLFPAQSGSAVMYEPTNSDFGSERFVFGVATSGTTIATPQLTGGVNLTANSLKTISENLATQLTHEELEELPLTQIIGSRNGEEIYGTILKDLIRGGRGEDLLHGGERDDILIGGEGEDTASYKILPTINGEGQETQSEVGISIKFDDAEEDDRFKVVAAASDGSIDFGADSLQEIERITLTEYDDLFRFDVDQDLSKVVPEGLALEIDALGNTEKLDEINFEDSKTRLTADELKAFVDNGIIKINDVSFKNFERLVTTNGDELLFSTTNQWSGGEGPEDTAAVDMKVRMILENDNLAEGGFGAFLDSINFLNIFLNHEYNSLGSLESVSLGEGNDFLAADASRLVEGDEVIREGLFEIKGEEGNDLLIAKNASYVPPQDAIPDDPDTEEDESTPAQPERRLTIDGGTGNDWIGTLGGTGAITVGGEGRDFIFNTSDFGQIYGDTIDGQRNKDKITADEFYDPENPLENSDVFWFWPGTFIQDARPNDILQIFGIPLVGGTNTVAGLGPIGDGSLAFDFFNWSTFYARTTSGQLLVYNAIAADLGIGPGGDFPDGVQVIENYRFGDAPDAFFGTPSAGDLGLSFRIFLPDDRASEGVQISKFLSVFGTIATFAIVASNLAKLNLFFFIPPQPSRKYCY